MKQKVFWAKTPGGRVQHLFHISGWNDAYVHSSCGCLYGAKVPQASDARKCKRCLRAIEK